MISARFCHLPRRPRRRPRGETASLTNILLRAQSPVGRSYPLQQTACLESASWRCQIVHKTTAEGLMVAIDALPTPAMFTWTRGSPAQVAYQLLLVLPTRTEDYLPNDRHHLDPDHIAAQPRRSLTPPQQMGDRTKSGESQYQACRRVTRRTRRTISLIRRTPVAPPIVPTACRNRLRRTRACFHQSS